MSSLILKTLYEIPELISSGLNVLQKFYFIQIIILLYLFIFFFQNNFAHRP